LIDNFYIQTITSFGYFHTDHNIVTNELGYGGYSFSCLLNPDPESSLKIQYENKVFLIQDYIEFSINQSDIDVNNKLTGEHNRLILPERALENLNYISGYFDPYNLFRIKVSDVEQGGLNKSIYILQALFGWNIDISSTINSSSIYIDVGKIHIIFNSSTETVNSIEIIPKYTEEEISNYSALTVNDLKIGNFEIGMDMDKLQEAIRLHEAYLENEEINNNTEILDGLLQNKYKYNSLEITISSSANIVSRIKYNGDNRDYETPRGIVIGDGYDKVGSAYGLPEIFN